MRVERLRESRGQQTQTEAAAVVGVTRGTWSSWERGRSEPGGAVIPLIKSCFPAAALVAESLRDHRVLAGLTQGELAAKVGVSVWTVSRVEAGNEIVAAGADRVWAEAVGVTVEEFHVLWMLERCGSS